MHEGESLEIEAIVHVQCRFGATRGEKMLEAAQSKPAQSKPATACEFYYPDLFEKKVLIYCCISKHRSTCM